MLASRDTNALRLFNGQSDGIDGLVIEQYAQVLVAQCHRGRLMLRESELRDVCERAMRVSGAVAVYRKQFVQNRSQTAPGAEAAHRHEQPWIGRPVEPRIAILENGMSLWIQPYDGFATGLYLDQRDNRRRVRGMASGRRVLNAFSYTCAFSVAAALGGAVETVSVDVSKKHLEWGKENFAANHIPLDGHHFICSDALEYLKRARKRGRRFDWIILDPPSFSRTKRPSRVFVLSEALPTLVAEALHVLDADGRLLISTNQRGMSAADLEQTVRKAARGRPATISAAAPLPLDFAGDADYAKSIVVHLD